MIEIIISAILTVVIAAVGFFIKNLISVVKELTRSVIILETTVKDTQLLNENIQEHHDLRLENHEQRISDNEDKIHCLDIKITEKK